MFLVFDTETNGLPRNYRVPAEYVDNWPHIVQLSWGIYDKDSTEISFSNYIIKPDNFSITDESTNIHGITNEIANKDGYPIKDVLNEFKNGLRKAQYIVAHNLNFDINVLGAECIRNQIKLSFRKIRKEICTMKLTTSFCKIPFAYSKSTAKTNGYKWPSLQELHEKIFHTTYEHGHNSEFDVKACARCLFYCIEYNIISV